MRLETSPTSFYDELVRRNAGLISHRTQQRLAAARIVIAGCGSTGGAAVVPLVRTGATDFLVADPDRFELSNLNRQNATIHDVGRNKAEVAAEHILAVNPHATVTVLPNGFPTSGVDELLTARDIVIDAIDVTTTTGIGAKKALHEAASKLRLPVITAYDIAGCQYVEIFDYRGDLAPLRGKVDESNEPHDVLAALIPPTTLPEEILPVLLGGALRPGRSFPQLAMTAQLFGALVVPVVLALIDRRRLPQTIRLDLFAVTKSRTRRLASRVRTLGKLPFVWLTLRRRGAR